MRYLPIVLTVSNKKEENPRYQSINSAISIKDLVCFVYWFIELTINLHDYLAYHELCKNSLDVGLTGWFWNKNRV